MSVKWMSVSTRSQGVAIYTKTPSPGGERWFTAQLVSDLCALPCAYARRCRVKVGGESFVALIPLLSRPI
jgi:hypothetical protein